MINWSGKRVRLDGLPADNLDLEVTIRHRRGSTARLENLANQTEMKSQESIRWALDSFMSHLRHKTVQQVCG